MTSTELFRGLSTGADLVAPILPGPAALALRFAGRAFALGADLLAAGKDPIDHITRIRERAPMLADVERNWEQRMRDKFGPRPDIYDE